MLLSQIFTGTGLKFRDLKYYFHPIFSPLLREGSFMGETERGDFEISNDADALWNYESTVWVFVDIAIDTE